MSDPATPPQDGVFLVGRRGYDPHQVDAHLRRVDAEIRILVADRDAAVDQAAQLGRELDEARLRADRLRTQVRTMAARPSDVQGMSERMRTMLRLAEDEVADMLRRADAEVARRLGETDANAESVLGTVEQQAAQIRDAARVEAEAMVAAAAHRQSETEAACAAQREAVAAERTAARQSMTEAAERADRARAHAWADSEARRATVEEDFRIAMDQRRAEALADIDAERARTVAWVQRSRDETTRQCRAELAKAEETARRIVASAQERVGEMADLRGQIALQLRGTQTQLQDVLAALAPAEVPQTVAPAPAPAPPLPAVPAPPVVEAPEPAPALPAPEPAPALPAAEPAGALPTASGSSKAVGNGAREHEPVTRPLPHVVDAPPAEDAPPAVDAAPRFQDVPAQTVPGDVLDDVDDPADDLDADVDDLDDPADEADADPLTVPNQTSLDPEARRRERRSATGATRR